MSPESLEPAFVLLVFGLTSAGGYVLATRGLRLAPRALGSAVGRMLECLGLTLVFLVANVVVGAGASLASRSLGTFVSLYLSADFSLLLLSLVQAVVFQWWREVSRPG